MSVSSGGATVPDYPALSLGEFLDRVASAEPAPGGGSVAAITVALAAALSGMAARFSADHLPDAPALADRADASRREVVPLAPADAEAYGRVLEAYRLPRYPDPEARREKIREALSGAADVPLAIAEAGVEVAEVAVRLAREGNPNLKGDALTAALLAEAGVRAAAELARMNLSSGGSEDGRRGRVDDLLESVSEARQRALKEVG